MSWKFILHVKLIMCLKADIEITVKSKNLNFIEVYWNNEIFVESANEILTKWVAACLKVLCHEFQD